MLQLMLFFFWTGLIITAVKAVSEKREQDEAELQERIRMRESKQRLAAFYASLDGEYSDGRYV